MKEGDLGSEAASVERALGRLEGVVSQLVGKVEELGNNSDAGRRRLYERIEELDRKVVEVANLAKEAAKAAAEAKKSLADDVMPTVNDVRRWKIAGITSIALISLGAGVVGTFANWAWEIIIAKITGP